VDENRFSLVGPFVVECTNGSTYLGQYRCWLASDPEKTVKFEGNARELGLYFEAVVLLPAVKLLLGKSRGAHATKTRAEATSLADMYVAGIESRWGTNLTDAMRKEFIGAWFAGYEANSATGEPK
jgi:hypothetical protein